MLEEYPSKVFLPSTCEGLRPLREAGSRRLSGQVSPVRQPQTATFRGSAMAKRVYYLSIDGGV
jgi:hypothetical protein